MTNNQPGLFDVYNDDGNQSVNAPPIAGLQYVPDFLTQNAHDQLLHDVDAQPWLTDLRRRVQHYGYKYDYTARRINHSMRIGPLPDWAIRIAEQIVERRLIEEMPDQLIVNEYQPGQGIAPHVDCMPCFTDAIASLSLGSPCVMNFGNKQTDQTIPLLLDPRSLVILKGEARYLWTHGIAARKTDEFRGQLIHRQRRVSLTFRKVILDSSDN